MGIWNTQRNRHSGSRTARVAESVLLSMGIARGVLKSTHSKHIFARVQPRRKAAAISSLSTLMSLIWPVADTEVCRSLRVCPSVSLADAMGANSAPRQARVDLCKECIWLSFPALLLAAQGNLSWPPTFPFFCTLLGNKRSRLRLAVANVYTPEQKSNNKDRKLMAFPKVWSCLFLSWHR